MKLEDLQKNISMHNWDAYIVSRNNMFIGQDVLDEENKIKELCGFSGSAGTLIVFADRAVLLVDGRYEIQAVKEVDTSKIEVVCANDSVGSWMNKNLPNPQKIAFDAWCHSANEVDYWQRTMKQHTFVEDDEQLLGARISSKEVNIFEHDIEFCGISAEEKISYLTKYMQENKLDAFFISEADAVSWMFNLRSNILKDTPILRAFALIDKDGDVSLFTTDFSKLEDELKKFSGKNVGICSATISKKIYNLMKKHKIWVCNHFNPIQDWKAIKNRVELDGFINAHVRDGVALVNFLYWLENNWQGQSELSIVDKLYEFRKEGKYFQGSSFETIAGFGEHGAIVHYQPNNETSVELKEGSVLLLDSGAQYLDGTTDVTRTIAIGKITNEDIKNSFTQVLKAHISIASAKFPDGISGSVIDTLARAPLWQYGKEYKHGTGHGVGHFLNVHEGPFSISSRKNTSGLKVGMVTSIEPGYYLEGQYGVRIENLVQIIRDDKWQNMLMFKPLTLVPIDKRLINAYLLSKEEQDWLNNYHQLVYDKLKDLLPIELKTWFAEACSPL